MEIPAIFSADINSFKNTHKGLSLTEFREQFAVIERNELPHQGTLTPQMSPKIVLDHFIDMFE